MSKAGDRILSRSGLLLFDCHLPQALSACDKPQNVPIFASRENPTKSFQIFISGSSSQQDLREQISINVHKIIKDQILGTKEIIDSPNRVWSRGKSVPDGVVQSKDQTYTMSMTKLSRGEHFTTCLMSDESWP